MLYRHFFKRLFDFVIALVGLIILSPLFLILWIGLSIANNKGGGAFFLQERPGKDEKIFKVIKFKTMNDRRDENGNLLPDSERLTTIGRWIRSLSLDELPQLINVLKGDMALVGPRPLLVQYLPLYDDVQRRRHEVRPGITGWAQVNGRNLLLLSKKFEYDVWYVDHLSFQLDVKIIFLTIQNVFTRKNIGEGANNMKDVDDLHFMERLKYENMKEFGSDYHYIEPCLSNGKSLLDFFPDSIFFANGRQAIQSLINENKWERIWLPEYFCYEIVSAIEKTGIKVLFYADNPLNDDETIVPNINYEEGDVLFRINYFGLRGWRTNKGIPVTVIEDHSHDLIGDWALNSDADWCIASIRKIIPIPEGGIIWSPKKHPLPKIASQSDENLVLVKNRWKAMMLKSDYLKEKISSKTEFRNLFIETEKQFSALPISSLTPDCMNYLAHFNIKEWVDKKKHNWKILSGIKSEKMQVLSSRKTSCHEFSFTMLFKSKELRDRARHFLINNNVYPTILWEIPEEKKNSKDISDRILCIPCDARYSKSINQLKEYIEKALNE